MLTKTMLFNEEAHAKILAGVKQATDAIGSTLGPKGRNVMIEMPGSAAPRVTKDGVSVAKEIHLADPFENMGAQLITQACQKTCDGVGDGTTTSSVLTYALFKKSLEVIKEDGINSIALINGMKKGLAQVITHINAHTKPVESNEDLRNIATTSANGDAHLGQIMADAFKTVGDGQIVLAKGDQRETTLEYQPGINLAFGYAEGAKNALSPDGSYSYENPYIFFHDADMTSAKMLHFLKVINALPPINNEPAPVIIFAHSFDTVEALPMLNVNNARKAIKVCPVTLPALGEIEDAKHQYDFLEDFCILTGAQMMEREQGIVFTDHFSTCYLGRCEVAAVSRDVTKIIGGKGNPQAIEARKKMIHDELVEQKGRIEKNDAYIRHLERRLAYFDPMAMIRAGGTTPSEIGERFDRIEDALYATRAVIENGYVPGGGIALLRASYDYDVYSDIGDDETAGMIILRESLSAPFMTILKNSGFYVDGLNAEFHEKDLRYSSYGMGINAKEGFRCNMIKAGIIDPAKVVISCIENAVSIASMLLTTGTMITYHDRDPNPLTNFKMKM